MTNFIHQLAQHIAQNHSDLSRLTVVLPSQRAVKYIQKALHEVYQRPFFSPNFITIDAFARSLTDVNQVDQVELLFKFYEIYQALGNNENFETFLNWSPLLISDCNDIDRYMVNANELFINLRDVRELEHWSFGENREISESQRQFLAFWDQLKDFYHQINESLEKENLAYAGSISKQAVHNVLNKVDREQTFIFAGFNALSEAEIQLMSRLVRLGIAKVILEADLFYLEQPNHEAGLFIRKTKDRIPETIIFKTDALRSLQKNIEVTSCAQSGSMLKVTQDILSKMTRAELNETVLLLADESLIVPTIKHIPKSVEVANITLGLPLKLTSLRPWVDYIFEFQRNFEYFKTDALYHKTISAFFKHPFVELVLTDNDRALIEKEEKDIIKFNKIFTKLKIEDFSEDFQAILRLTLFPWQHNFVQALNNIEQLNQLVFKYLDEKLDILERSAIYQFQEAVKGLIHVFSKSNLPEMTLASFEKFFNMRWSNESVAYYGNPIDGLQVMGLLETRLLQFKNVIVVGLNEGLLPSKNNINSLIPMDLRRFFGLPLPADKDAIYAHHFYRLLSGAEHIHILYSTNQGDDLAASEPSRYLQQIELELKPLSRINITHNSFNIPVSESFSELGFANSKEIQNRLLEYFRRGLSPSALNKFLKCPLDFYVRYVLKYNDDDEVEEGIESSTFGDVVHRVLEILYTPFVGEIKPVRVRDLNIMLEECDKHVETQFKLKFETSVDVFESGANYFALMAAKKQVRRFLKFEKNMLEQNSDKALFIVSLEAEYAKNLEINLDEEIHQIKIAGKIDRVDRFGGELRIIDYKTGKCDQKQVSIVGQQFKSIVAALEDLENFDYEEFKDLNEGYKLQLLFYLVAFYDQTGVVPDAIGIISMRNLNEGLQTLTIKNSHSNAKEWLPINASIAHFTSGYIKFLAERILATDYFEHNPKSKYCMICNE